MDYTTANFGNKTKEEVKEGDGKQLSSELSSRLTHLTNLSVQKKHPQFKELKQSAAMHAVDLGKYLISQGILQSEAEF